MSLDLANVEEQYIKNPGLKREDVKTITDWLEEQPHLPKIIELQILFFLQSCEYDLELTKKTIDNFFTIRSNSPEIFNSGDEDLIRRALSVVFVKVLPRYTPEGYMVIFSRLLDPKPENYHQLDQIKIMDMVVLRHIYKNGPPKGVVFIVDMAGFAFGHLTRVNLRIMNKHMHYVQEAAPLAIKSVHHVNPVSFVDKMMAIMKPFMKKELFELLHFHNSIEALYDFVPKEFLPSEYGGEAGTISDLNEETISDLVANMNLFKWQDSFTVDESKRPNQNQGSWSQFWRKWF